MRFVWIFLIAVVLDVIIVWGLPRHWKWRLKWLGRNKGILEFGFVKEVGKKLRECFWEDEKNRRRLLIVFELGLLALWALWVGRAYLDFDPQIIPAGREFSSAIQTHHLWTQFQECGWCALWNGSVRGGSPAFVDIYGSALHPIVMVTTLIFGVLNGAKVALVAALWFAGLAQWWLARVLNLGWLPRLWSAMMVIVGGHLAGRMELGVFGVVLSTAMCSLVFAAIILVARDGGRRAIVLLAVVSASTIMSGQGYIQVGLLGLFPAMLFLVFDDKRRITHLWKNYLIALGLALLLAALFLVPLAHFGPNFSKYTDPEFAAAQPLTYLPLNLLIDDWQYYSSELLGKLPYPYMYTLYIGWVPVTLAIIGLSRGARKDRRFLWFMAIGIVFEFLIGSAVLLRWLVNLLPAVAGVRHPSIIAGLAVPLILGLSAYGLEKLLEMDWPRLRLSFSERAVFPQGILSLKWILFISLFFSLQSGYRFTRNWIYVREQGDVITQLLEELKTESLQWVEPPFGEHPYIEPAIQMGLKISSGIVPWRWKDREFPSPVLEASRAGPPSGLVEKVDVVDSIPIYARYDQPYVMVTNNDLPCTASGSGGELEVLCATSSPGHLIVKENMWSGWKAWVDGERTPLLGDLWLEVEAPVGEHIYEFRYQPWDVPLGIFLSLIGVFLCVRMWFKDGAVENKSDINPQS